MSSWKSLLLRLGEKCPEYAGNADFKDQIEACYSAVRRELEHSGDDIFPFLLQCAEQLPHKIPLYGTLVGLLNLENEEFVAKLVENAQINLQDALETGKCNRIRILMRFLTVLMCSKVIQPSALVVIFECLLSSAATTVDEEKGIPSWQARADFYITCILSCLPWGGAELVEQVPEEIERVMVGVEAYLSIRKRVSDAGFSVFEDIEETNNAVNEKDFLEDLWSRVQDLSSRGWKLDSVPRPHLSFEAQLVAGKSHDLAPVSCPEQPGPSGVLSGIAFGRQKHEAELKYPQRIRRLNIFPSNKTEDIQPIDRFVVEEYLLDVLLFLNGCRKECTSYMVGLPVPFRYEYLMAETIFSQLLLLPQPPFKPTYYTLVIIDLCKALPGAFPAVVAGAVRALFDKIADLDMDCRTRLILWFSHHLSNFQFIWPWEEWAHVLDLPKWAPQRVFVQEVLEREVRLSYWDKIKQILRNAVSKTYNRISDLRKEISSLERSVVLAEEAASRARDQLDSAESKLSIMDGEPVLGENPVRIKRLKSYAEKAKEEEVSVRESLEAKEALLARAVDEIKVLILSLYKGFLTALAEPLNDAFRDGTLRPSGQADDMKIDLEDSSVMDLDKDDGGRPKKSHPNGSRERNGYNLDGKQQWCLSTLGYLKAFTRQYASEIWQNIENLDAEVLTEDAHPLFRKAIYCGLRRPLDE
ncbi:nuclear cap-binding protein subunit 1 isoform X4 [Nicotiana tomentosiformis]|uniref:nuclear cap-binding protein subunit 1 isoform X4 n=1 Tax=Nicotiana tomentosiformis TaxID=4098 RepID=UPI00051AF8FF|nr:nuclear cap-binding protein subunit 1 isoform X2 [Nicotiana tomentosiformis]